MGLRDPIESGSISKLELALTETGRQRALRCRRSEISARHHVLAEPIPTVHWWLVARTTGTDGEGLDESSNGNKSFGGIVYSSVNTTGRAQRPWGGIRDLVGCGNRRSRPPAIDTDHYARA
jgi:hypothetical protein